MVEIRCGICGTPFLTDGPNGYCPVCFGDYKIAKARGEAVVDSHDPLDTQVGGDHYKKLGRYQPWEVLAAWLTPDELRGAAKMTAIHYLCREREKGGIEDIRKAIHTLRIYLELLGNQ